MGNGGKLVIGMVINTATKPSRDVMLGILDDALDRPDVVIRLFHANPATTAKNLIKFIESGVDGLIFCGVRKGSLLSFVKAMPNHPPAVIVTNLVPPEADLGKIGIGGFVILDNAKIGRMAADMFLEHGLRNFAFFGSNGYREMMAGKIRCEAFRRRLEEKLGGGMSFSLKMSGTLADNEDFWVGTYDEVLAFMKSLPLPCGLLANGDREAFGLADICHRLHINVPDQVEILGVNNSFGLCDRARPAISSIFPDNEACAKKAMELVLALIRNPILPKDWRRVKVGTHQLVERGSTSNRRDHGHIAARARAYIQANACSGIGVRDVVSSLGVSQRTLEQRVRDATGKSVMAMIQSVRMEKICNLLKTTTLPISEVAALGGYRTTVTLGPIFRRQFGLSMRQYRAANGLVSKTET